MERPVVENKIAEVLKSHPKGSVLFVDDFLDYGNPESVKKALLRLKEKEILVRLAHGIYLYPKIDKELGVLFPSTEDIAKAIARRDKARIAPSERRSGRAPLYAGSPPRTAACRRGSAPVQRS